MINTDRIVPVMATDLLTLTSRIVALSGTTITSLTASDANGTFEVSAATTALFASEPVTTLDFASGVTAATVYFAPSYDYTGFTVAGTAVETTGDAVEADPGNFYAATLVDGGVTIAKIGL